jgi:hypothetical protein
MAVRSPCTYPRKDPFAQIEAGFDNVAGDIDHIIDPVAGPRFFAFFFITVRAVPSGNIFKDLACR